MFIKSMIVTAVFGVSAISASAATLEPYEVSKGSKTFVDAGTFEDVYLIDFSNDFAAYGSADVGYAFTELRFKDVVNIDFSSGYIAFSDTYGGPAFLTLTPSATPPLTTDVASTQFTRSTSSPFFMTIAGDVVGTSPGVKGLVRTGRSPCA